MMIGEHDAAIRRLAYVLTISSDVSVPILRVDSMGTRCAATRVSSSYWQRRRGDRVRNMARYASA